MIARIMKINDKTVVIKGSNGKFVTIPKSKLEFDYGLGDSIEIEKNGNTFYFLPHRKSSSAEDSLDALFENGEDDDYEDIDSSEEVVLKNSSKQSKAKSGKNKGPVGVSGWLLVFAILLIFTGIYRFANLGSSFSVSSCVSTYSMSYTSCRDLEALITSEKIASFIIGTLQFVTAGLIFSRKKSAVLLTIIMTVSSLLWSIIDLLIADGMLSSYGLSSSTIVAEAGGGIIGAVIYCAVWISYMIKSKRVENTLTR